MDSSLAPDRSSVVVEPAREMAGESLLDDVLRSTERDPGRPGESRLDRFLKARSPGAAISAWLGLDERPADPTPPRREITRVLSRDIARIDEMLAAQVNAIIHHPSFQKIEASWRGLRHLVDRLPMDDDCPIKIMVLNVTWGELAQDQDRALEFDQSQLFRKVYENEFGHPGGEPFGVLLGDYEIRHRPSKGSPHDDLGVLAKIAGVAAASFAPFIASVHPSFFELDDFAGLERQGNFDRLFQQADYLHWRELRKSEDARFIGLTLPRILMRLPYDESSMRKEGFRFREEVGRPDRSEYLWGSAAYAFAGVLIRCFSTSNWLADIRGVRNAVDDRGTRHFQETGGLVGGLPVQSFTTDVQGIARKCSTETVITDEGERVLDELGFIPLCHCHDSSYSAFYGNQSIQKPTKYDDPKATANAILSSKLQYILCTSRFAHYLKVMARDLLGSLQTPEECQDRLQAWLQNYVTASDSAGPEVKSRYPLREARVQVREIPDRPGTYHSVFYLRPHFQLDQMSTSVRFTTVLAAGRQA